MKNNDLDLSRPVILIVDDNEEILDFIADDLKETYHIIKAYNGREALDILLHNTIHLVVSDIMMEIMDGFELCKHIKSGFEYSHIPVILLTAKNTFQAKIEGLELGADAYIEKPFSPEHLQAQIANLLKNRDNMRRYYASSPTAQIKSMAYSKNDESFLEKLNEIVFKNAANTDFDVEFLAEAMNMSRPTLYRKIKAISNLTPHELINIARLKKAAQLLLESDHKIYEISEMIGYSSQTHFGRNFLKQFGMTPTEYVNSKYSPKTE